MGYQTFEELQVWKKARILKNEIKELTSSFPSEEKYRLTDQLIRSSRSVNTQIAEGHGRKTTKERIKYCIIARGSLSETLNHLIDAYDCKYITEEILTTFRSKIIEVERMLNGYINYLNNKLKSE